MSNLHPTMQVAIAPYFNLFAYRAAQVPMAIGWVPQHPATKPKPADMALLDAVAKANGVSRWEALDWIGGMDIDALSDRLIDLDREAL